MTGIEPIANVAKLKVVDLKEELSKRGLETTGLKKDLVERLEKAQDLARGGGTELAAPTDEVRDSAVPLGEKVKEDVGLEQSSAEVSTDGQEPSALEMPMEDGVEATVEEGKEKEVETALVPEPEGVSAQDEAGAAGVGHVMVEGATEAIEEVHEKEEKQAEEIALEQPKVLDDEVAQVVAEQEAKERSGPSPSPARAISPMPPSASVSPKPSIEAGTSRPVEGDRSKTPSEDMEVEMEDEAAEQEDIAQPANKRARTASPTPDDSTKRSKSQQTIQLPESLSHLLHPPTSTLFITNLRRPFLPVNLHDLLKPSAGDLLPPFKAPFSREDHPGLWLSGIKDHAYSTYPSIEEAVEVAVEVEGLKWPESTGQELHVEFIPDDEVRRLVEVEESAWAQGKKGIKLKIERRGDGQLSFELQDPKGGPVNVGPASRATAGNGIGGRPAPTGPTGYGPRAGSGVPGAPTGPSGPPVHPDRLGLVGSRAPQPLGRSHGDRGGFGREMGVNRLPLGSRHEMGPGGRLDRGPGGRYDRGPIGRFGGPGPGDMPGRVSGSHSGRQDGGDGRLSAPVNRTKSRPFLSWKEGPGGRSKI